MARGDRGEPRGSADRRSVHATAETDTHGDQKERTTRVVLGRDQATGEGVSRGLSSRYPLRLGYVVVATAAESTWRGESDLLLVRYFDMMGDPIDGEPMVTVEDMRGATFFADYAKADDHRMWVLEANKPDDAKQWQRA